MICFFNHIRCSCTCFISTALWLCSPALHFCDTCIIPYQWPSTQNHGHNKGMFFNKHGWFSGIIAACHAADPGSIPGPCTLSFSKWFIFSCYAKMRYFSAWQKQCLRPDSNWRPCACEAHVITNYTTKTLHLGCALWNHIFICTMQFQMSLNLCCFMHHQHHGPIAQSVRAWC